MTDLTQLNKENAGLEWDDIPADGLLSVTSRARGDIVYATWTKTGSPGNIVAPSLTFEMVETTLR